MVAGKSGSRDSEGANAEPVSTARSRQADHKSKKGGATPLDIARVKAETEALKKQVNRRSSSKSVHISHTGDRSAASGELS